MTFIFRDRREAGVCLASQLRGYAAKPGVVVLGLARGGIPVAAEVARILGVPLDVFTVRKIGAPGNAEFAIGAIASGGTCVLNDEVIRQYRITAADLASVHAVAQGELAQRERVLRGNRPPLDVHGSTVIIVDDGMATGSTMLAAIKALRAQKPVRVVVAVPVAAPEACEALRTVADECHCFACPPDFRSVGEWYQYFAPTGDQDIHEVLEQAMRTLPEDLLRSAQQAHHYPGLRQDIGNAAHR